MRPLRPNSRGAFVPTTSRLGTTRPEAPFSRPSPALKKLDRQRQGEPPSVLLVRSRGGIGDIIMTTPTAKAIAAKYNGLVDYCTDFGYLDGALPKAMDHISYIGKVVSVDSLALIRDNYDDVIPGLYAAGETTGGLNTKTYLLGCMTSSAMTQGIVAARCCVKDN